MASPTSHGVFMKLLACTLLVASSLPLGICLADERPKYYGESRAARSSAVFSTPAHRQHVVGVPPLRSAPDALSHPDAVPVEALALDASLPDALIVPASPGSKRTAFEKYCDQGKDMSDGDWRQIDRAGGQIPDALLPDCLPPK